MFPCFHEVVSAVPDHDRYPTLEELETSSDHFASAHCDVDMWRAGASRAGHPIRCLEVTGGPLQVLLVGMPHAEEPVGTLMLEHLLPLLAAEPEQNDVLVGLRAQAETKVRARRSLPRPAVWSRYRPGSWSSVS